VKKGHRRPAAESELIRALILRQDSMSRRTAGRIRVLLSTHLEAGAVARAWIGLADAIAAEVRQLPDQCAAQHAASEAERHRLRELVEEVLRGLTVSAAERRLAAEPPWPEDAEPVVVQSRSLTQARAQSARLMARWIDLKDRMRPYAGPGR
jgi:hypothetical protein